MAKDNAAPEGGDEQVVVPDEVLELDQPVEAEAEAEAEDETPDPLATVAEEMGWRPKDKFKGKAEEWKEPADYIRGLKGIQTETSRDLKNMRSQMETMSKTSAAILAERLQAEKERLSGEYSQAVEDGDPNKAWQIGQRINGVNQQAHQIQQPAGPPSESVDWVGRNQWFNTNPLARSVALETAQQYANAGKSTAEQLNAAEDEVRRAYPHLFASAKQAPGVSQPGSRSAGQSNRAKTAADMPREAMAVAKDMVERGVINSVEDYSRNYWASEGKGK